MNDKMRELVSLISEQVTFGEVMAGEQLAKVSAQIVKARLKREMNQKEFAEFMGVSQSMISKWESEDYNFTIEALAKICEKLNLTLNINLNEPSELNPHKKYDKNKWNINVKTESLNSLGVA